MTGRKEKRSFSVPKIFLLRELGHRNSAIYFVRQQLQSFRVRIPEKVRLKVLDLTTKPQCPTATTTFLPCGLDKILITKDYEDIYEKLVFRDKGRRTNRGAVIAGSADNGINETLFLSSYH